MTTERGNDLYLVYLRKQRGMRQRDLALASGIDASRLSLIEQGRLRPTDAQLSQLATALMFSPASALLRPVVVVLPEPDAETVALP